MHNDSDVEKRIVTWGDNDDIAQGSDHLAEMVMAALYVEGDLELEDRSKVKIEVLDSGLEERGEPGGCLGGGKSGRIWISYRLTLTPSETSTGDDEESKIAAVAERMQADFDAAVEKRDRQTLSVIRTEGMKNAVKLRGIERYRDLADKFQTLSDAANRALLPLCTE